MQSKFWRAKASTDPNHTILAVSDTDSGSGRTIRAIIGGCVVLIILFVVAGKVGCISDC